MKKSSFRILIAITAGVLFTSGCYYDKEEELYPQGLQNIPANVSFTGDIQPIISKSCATSGCHAADGQSPALTSYSQIAANKDQIKARAVDGNPSFMPASGALSQSDRTKLATWITKGALNN